MSRNWLLVGTEHVLYIQVSLILVLFLLIKGLKSLYILSDSQEFWKLGDELNYIEMYMFDIEMQLMVV